MKNKRSYWLRLFWFIIQGLKFSQTCRFHKRIVQNRTGLKKTFPEKPKDKTFEEIKKFHWAIVPIVQENQNAPKKSGSFTFIP